MSQGTKTRSSKKQFNRAQRLGLGLAGAGLAYIPGSGYIAGAINAEREIKKDRLVGRDRKLAYLRNVGPAGLPIVGDAYVGFKLGYGMRSIKDIKDTKTMAGKRVRNSRAGKRFSKLSKNKKRALGVGAAVGGIGAAIGGVKLARGLKGMRAAKALANTNSIQKGSRNAGSFGAEFMKQRGRRR